MQNLRFCNTGNKLPAAALPPRAAVHAALAKPTALQPPLAALQTTLLFAIEGNINKIKFIDIKYYISFLQIIQYQSINFYNYLKNDHNLLYNMTIKFILYWRIMYVHRKKCAHEITVSAHYDIILP